MKADQSARLRSVPQREPQWWLRSTMTSTPAPQRRATSPPQSRATASIPAPRRIVSLPRLVTISGRSRVPQPLQRRQVHMVVMIVADEDEVDPRQILEAHARRADPASGR